MAAMAEGVDFFDHADIYGGGVCEERFKEAAEEAKISREDMWIQSKCGIVPGVMYDFSKEHIIKSAEDSLQRLGTDYLDSLLLHRPDALMEPEEVAAAFEGSCIRRGKVRYFGVSNQNTMQMELLSRYVSEPLMADQLQFGAAHASMIASGVEVNMTTPGSVDRDGSVLDYCRLHDITIQAWSPFQYGMIEGVFLNSDKFAVLNEKIREICRKVRGQRYNDRHRVDFKDIPRTAGSFRHNESAEAREICKACEITLTREEWYAIYMAAGHMLP